MELEWKRLQEGKQGERVNEIRKQRQDAKQKKNIG